MRITSDWARDALRESVVDDGTRGNAPAEVSPSVRPTAEQVERVCKDIDVKQSATRYLHLGPGLVEPAAETGGMP
jgi:hypothetical protein